jgi:AcrR family transcriptional regulator
MKENRRTSAGINTGTRNRTRTPSAGMEGALLTSAADILETEGPDGLSVRRIAAAAGVAPMGVYNHFESKFGIVEALFVQGFDRLGTEMAAMAQITDPSEALREGARRYRALALAHPMAYQVMFLRAVPGFEPSDRALGNCTGAFDSLVAAVQRAMEAGVIAAATPTETAQVIWATIHGWVSLELLGIGFVEDQDAGYERLCDALLRGLRPDPD